MNRRKSIGLIGVGSCLFAQNTFASGSGIFGPRLFNDGFMDSFRPRWKGLRTHTFEVLEAMPEAQFDFQPTTEVMSFSSLFSHIGRSLEVYAGMLDGTAADEGSKPVSKAEVHTSLKGSFDLFERGLTQLNAKNLYTPTHEIATRDGSLNMSDYDIIMLAYNHTVHHKGQATTYLRLAGATPPQYRY
jgi:uncharacterized damage-inducible protein DinB